MAWRGVWCGAVRRGAARIKKKNGERWHEQCHGRWHRMHMDGIHRGSHWRRRRSASSSRSCLVMAMACVVMAYVVMACIVMAAFRLLQQSLFSPQNIGAVHLPMHMSMHMPMHTCLCTCLRRRLCTGVYAHVCAHVYARLDTCLYAHVYATCPCTCLRTCLCTCLCTCLWHV